MNARVVPKWTRIARNLWLQLQVPPLHQISYCNSRGREMNDRKGKNVIKQELRHADASKARSSRVWRSLLSLRRGSSLLHLAAPQQYSARGLPVHDHSGKTAFALPRSTCPCQQELWSVPEASKNHKSPYTMVPKTRCLPLGPFCCSCVLQFSLWPSGGN